MDKIKFKEWIKTVAEIKELSPKKDPNIRLDNDAQDLVRHGDEWVEVTAKANPTLGFQFVKLKDKTAVCELGCGDIVSNQVVEKRFCESPQPHWRTRCNNCGCFVSPDGVGFIEGGHQVQAAYVKFFKGEQLRPELKPNQTVKYDNGREYIEEVINDSIIRKYK